MDSKYRFSFTAAPLRLSDMLLIAKNNIEGKEVDIINDLGGGKTTTGKRIYQELNRRLSYLTQEQLELFVNASLTTQKQIAFLSIVKTYRFIWEFVVEIVREKYLLFDYEITEGNYLSFFRQKQEENEYMDDLTTSTTNKLKQVLFKILEEVTIIDNTQSKQIQPQILEDQLVKVIVNDQSEWLKAFLMSDIDIENCKKK